MSHLIGNSIGKSAPIDRHRARAFFAPRAAVCASGAIAARTSAEPARQPLAQTSEAPRISVAVVVLLVVAALAAVAAVTLLWFKGPGAPVALAPTATATPPLATETTPAVDDAATATAAALAGASQAPPATPAPATVAPTQTAIATPEAPTAEPTATSPPPPPPTHTVAPTWTPCPLEIDPGVAPIWARDYFGCALEPAVEGAWAYQPMERGMLFWSQGRDSIVMLANSGQWIEVPDNWDETKPELSCEATPPEGLIQPKRGFGLAWCTQPAMRDALGFALVIEEPTDARMQQVEAGYLLYHVARGTAYLLQPDGTWLGLAAP